MSSTGYVILLLSLAFFVVVGISATGNLLDTAKASNDSTIIKAASGAQNTMSQLWMIFAFCIMIISAYALIHSYSTM